MYQSLLEKTPQYSCQNAIRMSQSVCNQLLTLAGKASIPQQRHIIKSADILVIFSQCLAQHLSHLFIERSIH